MKKFLSLLCMITCIFGLTACGSEEALTDYEQFKIENAKSIVVDYMLPTIQNFQNPEVAATFEAYTAEEAEYVIEQSTGLLVDGYALMTAIESFDSAYDTIGNIVSIGEATAEIDDKQIIVRVAVQGEKENAEAEFVLTNDLFYKMESAALNPEATMGDLMVNAALNTLIGMGTVFVVLILISLIISAFGVIPKIQDKLSKKNKKEEVAAVGIENAVAQIASNEEVVEDLTDDLELVAVIAAAIAASEGAASTDGFVVRSIRRAGRR